MTEQRGAGLSHVLAALFFAVSVVFVYRSFYGMRIEGQRPADRTALEPATAPHM